MTHASLFSGIGAAELAATWMGWTNLFHCEIDKFCNKILDYWFPKSIAYEDIRKTDFTEWHDKVDVLTGGFPCQPFSLAGKRKGEEDDRYLFPEMLRAISEIHPTWVVGENVAGLITMVQPGSETDLGTTGNIFDESHLYRKEQRYVLSHIIDSIERIGYEVQTFVIPACAVGAPHRRDRVWIIAHSTDARTENQHQRQVMPYSLKDIANADSVGRTKRNNKIQSVIADGEKPESNGIEWDASDSDSNRQWLWPNQPFSQQEVERPSDARSTCKTTCSQSKGSTCQGNNRNNNQQHSSSMGSESPQSYWKNFPSVTPVCSRNDGLPFDVDSLAIPFAQWRRQSIKAYGNSIVPQVMYEIFRAIVSTYEIK